MKVNMSIDVTDEQRRRIRAHFGRGGACTRSEFRTWLYHLMANANLPQPKVRACNTSRRKDLERETEKALTPIHPATLCAHCGETRADHLGMLGRLCPASKKARPGSVFKAVQ